MFGGYTFSFGPPSITGGDSTSFYFTTMISDAIRETLGVNATKNWPEWYPEHYQNPGASLDVEEEGGAAISRETEILYFFKPEHDYDGQESHHPLVVYGDHRLSLVSDPEIEKFVSQKVADEMNNLGKKWPLFAENGIKFVFENKQIQVQNADGKQVTFKQDRNTTDEVPYAILDGSKYKTDFVLLIAVILFLALRRVHLPRDSFAVIEGGRSFSSKNTIENFFSTFLKECPQVIFLTDSPSTWGGERGYNEGLKELKQSQKRISRVYRITGKGINERFGSYDGDNAKEMELHFAID